MVNKCRVQDCNLNGRLKGLCDRHYGKQYYEMNRKRLRANGKIYYFKNRNKILQGAKQYYKDNREKVLEYHKEYGNRLDVIECRKKYAEENKERFKKWRQEYSKRPEIKERKKIYMKDYIKRNKEYLDKYNRSYRRKLWTDNIQYKLREILGTRIRRALKKGYKKTSSIELLGCSIPELKQHLEQQFKKGMNWNNHGAWHIDHIKPCASFDLTKEEEQKRCFHYTNLQPLWARDNLVKNCKVEG